MRKACKRFQRLLSQRQFPPAAACRSPQPSGKAAFRFLAEAEKGKELGWILEVCAEEAGREKRGQVEENIMSLLHCQAEPLHNRRHNGEIHMHFHSREEAGEAGRRCSMSSLPFSLSRPACRASAVTPLPAFPLRPIRSGVFWGHHVSMLFL